MASKAHAQRCPEQELGRTYRCVLSTGLPDCLRELSADLLEVFILSCALPPVEEVVDDGFGGPLTLAPLTEGTAEVIGEESGDWVG
jgi:hypothetical protein